MSFVKLGDGIAVRADIYDEMRRKMYPPAKKKPKKGAGKRRRRAKRALIRANKVNSK
jgi:hypothetical protein